jgi:hypothetical protein
MNVDDLLAIGRRESNASDSFVLGQDVDLGGMEWTPIGKGGTNFRGTFDGAGFAISNFKISSTVYSNGNYSAGFFVYNSGTIKNLNLTDFEIDINELGNDTLRVVGGVASGNSGTIDNCHVTATQIHVTAKMQYTGGVVGDNNKNGKITGCSISTKISTSAFVNGGSTMLGGICGINSSATVSDCVSNCSAIGSNTNGYAYVGGLVGKNQNTALVTRSYSDSKVSSYVAINGAYSYAGGLVGYSENSNITACYATGNVRSQVGNGNISGDSASVAMYARAGGLVGAVSKGTVTQCYATGDVEAESITFWGGSVSAGGLIGYAANATIKSCYATGNMTVVGMYDYCNYAGGVIAEDKKITKGQLYGLDTQEFSINNNGPISDSATNSYDQKVSIDELLTADFLRDTVGFSETYWVFTDSEHPTFTSNDQ